MSIFYVNGKYVDSANAMLPANDLAVLRGYGVFDFLRTYGGKPFQLGAHLRRLQRSSELLGLACPWDIEELMSIVMETLERNPYEESNIRLVVTGGDSPDNFMPQGDSRLIVMVTPVKELDDHYYTAGAEVVTMNIERYIPGAKSLNYIPAIIARRQSLEMNPKSIETIYRVDGNIIEGTTSNTFMFKDGTWVTAGDRLLPGITRAEVIKLIDGYSQLETRDISVEEYRAADEVIITSSNKEVVPIVKVDDTIIGDGQVGEKARALMKVWREMTETYAQGEMV